MQRWSGDPGRLRKSIAAQPLADADTIKTVSKRLKYLKIEIPKEGGRGPIGQCVGTNFGTDNCRDDPNRPSKLKFVIIQHPRIL